jgi:hypothetical protein
MHVFYHQCVFAASRYLNWRLTVSCKREFFQLLGISGSVAHPGFLSWILIFFHPGSKNRYQLTGIA